MLMDTLKHTYMETLKLGIGLVIIMGVNLVLGTVNSIFESDFRINLLIKGIGKTVILILCFCATYAAGVLNKDTLSIELGSGSPVDIVDAMHALLLAGYFSYSKQVLEKISVIVGGGLQKNTKPDDKGEPEKPVTDIEYADPPDEEEGDYD